MDLHRITNYIVCLFSKKLWSLPGKGVFKLTSYAEMSHKLTPLNGKLLHQNQPAEKQPCVMF